ncbi:hypothetical protein F2P81_003237 [Scophthalmus maximus]|uniref:Uncharacterized protein n=1 Tax=Scophthalmus maximus TaxID=52904 RepID=A0A6A4TGX7_SCOMX|nr:hypothetical protein F2P81_003237 [Scophthalmus maximus]
MLGCDDDDGDDDIMGLRWYDDDKEDGGGKECDHMRMRRMIQTTTVNVYLLIGCRQRSPPMRISPLHRFSRLKALHDSRKLIKAISREEVTGQSVSSRSRSLFPLSALISANCSPQKTANA